MIEIENVVFDSEGLVPAIIQDSRSQKVLMLGYMNRETLRETTDLGKVVFWSRSRNVRWLKGETSGNFLSVDSIARDCDSDSLLISVTPAGPTCHTGSTSCFEAEHD